MTLSPSSYDMRAPTRARAESRPQASAARAQGRSPGRLLSSGLGWFSIGLGLAELAAPRTMARLVGVRADDDNRATLQAAGLRELASGIGILGTERPSALLWGRFAGDVMDLLLLAGASSAPDSDRRRVALATAAVLGVTALDLVAAVQQRGNSPALERTLERVPRLLPSGADHGVKVKTSITINRPRAEVYAAWRRLEDLPSFMSHLESVEVIDARHSRWRAKAPLGQSVAWEAEIITDVEGEQLSWKSLPGALIDNAGSVRFRDAPGARGTELLVELAYHPPAGALGAMFAKLFGEEPSQQVRSDLRRFKQVQETGEVLHSDASVHRGAHSAQPSQREGAHS